MLFGGAFRAFPRSAFVREEARSIFRLLCRSGRVARRTSTFSRFLLSTGSMLAVAPIVQLTSRMEEFELISTPVESDDNASSSAEEMPDADEPSVKRGTTNSPTQLNFEMKTLDAGGACIPHPEKAHKGGEDAFHVSTNHRVLAVADGVGGWAELNVDPALFSKRLCATVGEHSQRALESDDEEVVRDVLQHAYDETCDQGIEGSTTLCSTFIYPDHIITCNLGDSGLRLIRNNEVVYRTREQTHQFNFPFQLGSRGRGEAEHPQDAAIERFDVEPGDVVVIGSDGLIDNVFDAQIIKLVRDNMEKSAEEIALIIARSASAIASDPCADTPFARDAAEHGLTWFGGKLDDITVVVAKL